MLRICPHCQTENTVATCGECGSSFVVTEALTQGRTREFDDGPVSVSHDERLPSLCDVHMLMAAGRQGGVVINAGMRQTTCANCHRDFLLHERFPNWEPPKLRQAREPERVDARPPEDRPIVTDIRLGVLGSIVAGPDIGRVVEVIDDTENSGGYAVFTYADMNRSPEIFDNWFPSVSDVQHHFTYHGYEIDWGDPPQS